MSLPAGAVVVVSNKGLASALIRLGTRSRWSHTAIADGRGNLVEALGYGVRVSAEDRYAHLTRQVITVPGVDGDKAAAWAALQVGRRYNWPAIGVFALSALGWHDNALARWANRRDAVICSELVALALRRGGVDPWPGRLAATISPADIDLTASVLGWRRLTPKEQADASL